MWEFIKECGMLKNIYFTYYYKLKRSIIDYSAINLEIQGHVKRLKHLFNQGKTSKETCSRIKAFIHITESGMLKKIYFTCYYKQKGRIIDY